MTDDEKRMQGLLKAARMPSADVARAEALMKHPRMTTDLYHLVVDGQMTLDDLERRLNEEKSNSTTPEGGSK